MSHRDPVPTARSLFGKLELGRRLRDYKDTKLASAALLGAEVALAASKWPLSTRKEH